MKKNKISEKLEFHWKSFLDKRIFFFNDGLIDDPFS